MAQREVEVKIGRSLGVAAGLFAMTIAVFAGPSTAQAEYPEKGLTLIVAYTAGGGTDISARLLAKDLETTIGHPVTVQNMTGGGGWTGWSAIANGKPDGYTIGYINIPSMFAGYLDPKIGRPERLDSFTLLVNHVTDYCIWAVKADSPFKSIGDVIAAAKSKPGGVSIAAHGYGGDDHLAILSMQDASGVKFKIVHNRGTADSKSQVLGRHVDVLGANLSEVAAEHNGGELRVLGVMSRTRSEFLPGVPTFKEQGFNQEWAISRGVAAPRGLPRDKAEALIRFLESTITSAGHKAKAARLGFAPELMKGKMYVDFLKTKEQQIKKLMGW